MNADSGLTPATSGKLRTIGAFAFESFGVKVRVAAYEPDILAELRERVDAMFPEGLARFIRVGRADFRFSVRSNRESRYVLFLGRNKVTGGNDRQIFLKFLDSRLRLTVAEYAKERVFVHAGVVEWMGKAILIPGRSFSGKTTLIRELTQLGARYYSDEYAALDDRGLVHPFTKTLSVRSPSSGYAQEEVEIESIGGRKGTIPIPVGMILLTEFESGSMFEPSILGAGTGILELLPHTIAASFRPEYCLNVLNNAVSRAIIVRSKRGEARDFAVKLLSFFEKQMQ